MDRELVPAWQFERGVDPAYAARATLERAAHPDLYVVRISSHRGIVRVQMAVGAPSGPDAVLYLGNEGLFAIAGSEQWPPDSERGRPRTVLSLTRWSGDDAAARAA